MTSKSEREKRITELENKNVNVEFEIHRILTCRCNIEQPAQFEKVFKSELRNGKLFDLKPIEGFECNYDDCCGSSIQVQTLKSNSTATGLKIKDADFVDQNGKVVGKHITEVKNDEE